MPIAIWTALTFRNFRISAHDYLVTNRGDRDMSQRKTSETRARFICDLAKSAVMKLGAFEQSGQTRLLVMRSGSLTICYHTPFNPPKPSDTNRTAASVHATARAAYRIDVWADGEGKVFSAQWGLSGEIKSAILKSGTWQEALCSLASSEGNTKRPMESKQRRTDRRVHALEEENRRLRNTIANLAFDRIALADASPCEMRGQQ